MKNLISEILIYFQTRNAQILLIKFYIKISMILSKGFQL